MHDHLHLPHLDGRPRHHGSTETQPEVPLSLTSQLSTGIPWDLKHAELMPEGQWQMLLAIMEAVVPTVQRELTAERRSRSVAYISDQRYDEAVSHLKTNTILLNSASPEALDQYLAEKTTEKPLFQQVLKGMLHHVPLDIQTLLFRVLWVLSTRAGSLVLTGYATPITRLPIEDRTHILNGWSNSSLSKIRGLYKQLTFLGKLVFSATSETFQSISGFPVTPAPWKPPPRYQYDFINFPSGPIPAPVEIHTDVVIVGSGCGAAVCAKNLSAAGHSVLVVDKGYHFESEALPMAMSESFFHLFDGGASVASDDNSIVVLSGNCFGGGGTVNWSASLQTQGFVRKEWVEDKGLGFFGTADFQESLDRVCAYMGVGTESVTPNHGNALLIEGGRKLGWAGAKVPQNTDGCAHDDGHCTFGCWSGEKKGPANRWFREAASCGAKFMEGFKVQKVMFDDDNGPKKKATGVLGTWTSRGKDGKSLDGPNKEKTKTEVVVRAKRVVISGGTMWSPMVLLNSGLKNPNIGKNLYLHPVNCINAFFKEDVRPWEGGILTTVVTAFENMDGKGHGVKLECLSMMPCFSLPYLNWTNGADWKLCALKYRHMNGYISIVRDRDSGYVYPDPVDGSPRIVYTPSNFDRKHALIGLIAIAKILYLQGALEIHPALPGLRPFIREESDSTAESSSSYIPLEKDNDLDEIVSNAGVADPRFQKWLKELEAHGNKPPLTPFTSAHQMGTCRMSTSEKTGVVDPRGRVWGTQGLYVADASVFPSASGVNPMITNMAISDWISGNVAVDIKNDLRQVAKL